MSRVVEIIQPIIEEVIAQENCYWVDTEYIKEGPNWYLRVYADRDGGIDLNDCARISEKLGNALDALEPDPFPKAYFLEVSSPGAERTLKTEADLLGAIGKYIHLDYYSPQYQEKFHEGTLLAVTDDVLTIEVSEKTRKRELEINRQQIAKARLAIKF